MVPQEILDQIIEAGLYAASGMGKFGMGLPNASISQANRVEVYSWQNGECFYTYLDVDEIKKGRRNSHSPGLTHKTLYFTSIASLRNLS